MVWREDRGGGVGVERIVRRADHLLQQHRRFGALQAWHKATPAAGARRVQATGDELKIEPIGFIETPFPQAEGAPVQPSRANGARGRVRVQQFLWDGLRDLAGFDRIWLIYWLHKRQSTAVAPFLDCEERGVFATRVPARPNPIGISAVRLIGIEDGVLEVADVDMVDGTPLLDIKPYVPEFDSYPASKAGWLEQPILRDSEHPRSAGALSADAGFAPKCKRLGGW